MTVTENETWTDRNQRALATELDRVHAQITGETAVVCELDSGTRAAQLRQVFRLSSFEYDLLLWCAGAELDPRFAPPTLGEALAVLENAHWDALAPAAPLRHWQLTEFAASGGLISRPLRIDERILHHLTGVTYVDPGLRGLVEAHPGSSAPDVLTAAQSEFAAELAASLSIRASRAVVRLDGAGDRTRLRIAAHVADALGLLLLAVPGERLPSAGRDNAEVALLVEREVALLGALLYVTAEDTNSALVSFVDALGCSALVAAPGFRADITRVIPETTSRDQRELWERFAGPGPEAAILSGHFRFEPPDIESIAADLGQQSLQDACRVHVRSELAELADRVEPSARWGDLVLPEAALDTLHDIANQVRYRGQVYEDWRMAHLSQRGLGVSALFTGESGTGKTLAAEVLAGELNLDLYRIDLAGVVSKYIGETEKNLKRVFDAADASGAVLLFDEADAIFGKRSEVRDSHDRYANLEISYLLGRMDTYRGLAILTTNMRAALDRAFLRRINFVVGFPFPDVEARVRIWQLMFPPEVPLADLNWQRLAQLQIPGGHIRTVALGAAFLAAAAGESVSMRHVMAAARREYVKLEKPLTDAEIRGWT
ncbi:ATP-binding protein [Mycobacterium sp. C3-094]